MAILLSKTLTVLEFVPLPCKTPLIRHSNNPADHRQQTIPRLLLHLGLDIPPPPDVCLQEQTGFPAKRSGLQDRYTVLTSGQIHGITELSTGELIVYGSQGAKSFQLK